MNEFYSRREQVEQDISDEEIAENARRFLQEGREILLSWPEFKSEASRQIILRESFSLSDPRVKFQRGGTWFVILANENRLDITWADSENAIEEEVYPRDGAIERIDSREIGISYNEKPLGSEKPYGRLSYVGTELKIPTKGSLMPENTKAVVEQIKKSLVELKKL